MTYYSEDLAFIHDRGYGALARAAGPALTTLLQEAGIDRGRVVELGCGSGLSTRPILDAGFDVTGYDLAAPMLARARERVPEATLHEGSLWEVTIPEAVAVTAFGEVLGYRPDGAPLPDRAALFRRVAESLIPRGLLVFDVIVSGDRAPLSYRSWHAADDWAVLFEATEDLEAGRLIREITIFRELEGGYRRSSERHTLDVLDADDVTRELRDAGLEVEVTDRYGELEIARGRVVFVARKPG